MDTQSLSADLSKSFVLLYSSENKLKRIRTVSASKIKNEGLFNTNYISRLIDEHMQGKADHRKKLWTLFIFELWLKSRIEVMR